MLYTTWKTFLLQTACHRAETIPLWSNRDADSAINDRVAVGSRVWVRVYRVSLVRRYEWQSTKSRPRNRVRSFSPTHRQRQLGCSSGTGEDWHPKQQLRVHAFGYERGWFFHMWPAYLGSCVPAVSHSTVVYRLHLPVYVEITVVGQAFCKSLDWTKSTGLTFQPIFIGAY